MDETFNNAALFIKRAEEYQTMKFIIDVFATNNIGKVRNVRFIKKNDSTGRTYNGAIVIFDRWCMNTLVQTLLNEMSTSIDGTTKFYFEPHKYWIINIHRQKLAECQETTIVDQSLPDKEKISHLESLIKSMSAQIYYMQSKQERTERLMMEYEQKETHQQLVNMELRFQLEEHISEQEFAFKQKFEELNNEKVMLQSKIATIAIDYTRKVSECERIQQELGEAECIISFVENQNQEMKKMLLHVVNEDSIKQHVFKYFGDLSN